MLQKSIYNNESEKMVKIVKKESILFFRGLGCGWVRIFLKTYSLFVHYSEENGIVRLL